MPEQTGHIYAFITCERVKWEEGSEDPIEENGWIDRAWSPYALHFVRKFLGPDGWTEQAWHPVEDGGFKI